MHFDLVGVNIPVSDSAYLQFIVSSISHAEVAVMRVAPGDLTDVYYIIISNLPWSTTQERLRNFAINHQPDGSEINIDLVYIYENSTYGWLRIRGKDEFLKAKSMSLRGPGACNCVNKDLDHLQRGIFEGRALQVDFRNETEATVLRDLVPTPNPSRPESLSTRDLYRSSSYSSHGHGRSTGTPSSPTREVRKDSQG